MRGDRGVSDTIGVVLMVAIAVIMAATVFFWVGFKGGGTTAPPALALSEKDQANGGTASFSVTSISGAAKWSDIIVTIDGSKGTYDGALSGSAKFCVQDGDSGCVPTDQWDPTKPVKAGQILFVHDASLDFGSKVNIIHKESNTALQAIKVK